MPMPMPGAPSPPPQAGVAGPASAPGPMEGAVAGGAEKLKLGLKALQDALPSLPMGSSIHTAVLKALTDIGKAVEKEGGGKGDPGAMIEGFINVPISQDGELAVVDGISAPGGYVDLRAEMDLLVVISNCPQLNNPCNAYNPTPIRVTIWGAQS